MGEDIDAREGEKNVSRHVDCCLSTFRLCGISCPEVAFVGAEAESDDKVFSQS